MSHLLNTQVDRNTAQKLNPFIGHSTNQSMENLQQGMAFLVAVTGNMADGCTNDDMLGFSVLLSTMSAALAYEQQTIHSVEIN